MLTHWRLVRSLKYHTDELLDAPDQRFFDVLSQAMVDHSQTHHQADLLLYDQNLQSSLNKPIIFFVGAPIKSISDCIRFSSACLHRILHNPPHWRTSLCVFAFCICGNKKCIMARHARLSVYSQSNLFSY